ncbi:DUF6920 family protein [Bifidobacterium phasiani]|uniref:DUF6920 family protein n=1 Tax=Bifidobacterium phasiani TaxID=2834431 RepID=UPI003B836574
MRSSSTCPTCSRSTDCTASPSNSDGDAARGWHTSASAWPAYRSRDTTSTGTAAAWRACSANRSSCFDQHGDGTGIRHPTRFRAVWHLSDGDFTYFDGEISEIAYQ